MLSFPSISVFVKAESRQKAITKRAILFLRLTRRKYHNEHIHKQRLVFSREDTLAQKDSPGFSSAPSKGDTRRRNVSSRSNTSADRQLEDKTIRSFSVIIRSKWVSTDRYKPSGEMAVSDFRAIQARYRNLPNEKRGPRVQRDAQPIQSPRRFARNHEAEEAKRAKFRSKKEQKS